MMMASITNRKTMSSTSNFDKAVNTFTSVTAMDPNGYGMTMLIWKLFAIEANHGSIAKRQRQLACGMRRTSHP